MASYPYEEPEFPEDAKHKIIVLAGASASGKTTWRKEFMKFHQDEDWRVINSDEIRMEYAIREGISYNDTHTKWHSRIVTERFNDAIRDAVKDGANILIDAVSSHREGRMRLLERIDALAQEFHPGEERFYDQRALVNFLITKEEALERNAKRDEERIAKGWIPLHIPEEVIDRFITEMSRDLEHPNGREGFNEHIYHFSDGYRAQNPTIARALEEAVEKAHQQKGLV